MRNMMMGRASLLGAALAGVLATPDRASAIQVTSVVDTGTSYTPNEMAVDRSSGQIFLTGATTVNGPLSIVEVVNGSLVTRYATLPGSVGGDLTYTNGFATDGTTLWWNNANSGPLTNTEITRGSESGGNVGRTSPANDLDSLAWDGTTMFTATNGGLLYTVSSEATYLPYLGYHRGDWSTDHLALAAESGVLYVVDKNGVYRRNLDGTFTDLDVAGDTNRYRTNGSRLGIGGGSLWALDATNLNGFWQISTASGAATWITDASFTDLTSIAYYGGNIYVSDTGGAGNGHVWQVNLSAGGAVPEPATLSLAGLAAAALAARSRRGRR